MSINKATLIGRVGKDPEVRTFDNGSKVANFSLATSERWKAKEGEQKEATEWHNVAVFGKLADIVEKYVTKGQQLYIEGKIKTRNYDDKDGVKRYVTEIVLNGFGDVLQMLGGKAEAGSSAPSHSELPDSPPELSDDVDGLPF